MTPVITSLLNPHITRLNGSMGSGTDFGRTTLSATGKFVKPATFPCPRANIARFNIKTASIEMQRRRRDEMFLTRNFSDGGIFSSFNHLVALRIRDAFFDELFLIAAAFVILVSARCRWRFLSG